MGETNRMAAPKYEDKSLIKVLVLSVSGAGGHYSGIAMSTYRMLTQMKSVNPVRFDLAHFSDVQEETTDLFDNEINLRVHKNGIDRAGDLSRATYGITAAIWCLRHGKSYDLVYLPSLSAECFLPALILKIMGLSVVGRVASAEGELPTMRRGLRSMLALTLRRIFLKQVDAIVAISVEISARLTSYGLPSNKNIYIPNGVDIGRFATDHPTSKLELKKKFSLQAADKVIVCVGGLSRRKGQHILVEALALMPVQFHLFLVGPPRDPDYKTILETRIAALSLENRCHFLTMHQAVHEVYAASDYFVLPSEDEGMPNALLEAMSTGLVCLATPVSGSSELMGASERGIVVQRDPSEIAEKLLSISSDQSLTEQYRTRARSYILENHSLDATSTRVFELFRELKDTRQRIR